MLKGKQVSEIKGHDFGLDRSRLNRWAGLPSLCSLGLFALLPWYILPFFFRFFEGVVKGKKDIERVGGMLVQML